jgi:acyl-CoA thioester hydrolase
MSTSDEFVYRHRLSVRFRDCDAMGHVNHAVYLTYFEQARLTFWRELTGTPSPHTRVIIARAECDYRSPAHFGDELEVRIRVGDIGDRLVATGKTVLVSYDYEKGASMPLPADSRELLRRLNGPKNPKGSDLGQT